MSTSKWDKNKWEGQAAAAKVTLGNFHHIARQADFCDVPALWVGSRLGALAHLAVSWQPLAQGHCHQVLPSPACVQVICQPKEHTEAARQPHCSNPYLLV